MDDGQIVNLYWERCEDAITETDHKYGKYCYSIAYNILHNKEDSEECVNDTYMRTWKAIPPQKPKRLAAFLGKITRNLSLNRYEKYTAAKRGHGQMALALEEIKETIPSGNNVEAASELMELAEILNDFLSKMSTRKRKVFMRRYWYFSSVQEIAKDYGISESSVKMILLRARNDLKEVLEKEGISI